MKIKNRKQSGEIELKLENKEMSADTVNNSKLSFKDKQSICILTFLYIMQGIPLGLAGSVPLILQSKKVSYSTQATFSFVFWPFSLKLLWAPIVDALYVLRFGRRKTWLIPAQYLIGITMVYVSYNINQWLGGNSVNDPGNSNSINIMCLAGSFFLLNFLAATQDIAVDGWALTMLSKANVGWASTCNSVGQTIGYFTAFIVFLALESAEFCNTWFRSVPEPTGLVTFQGFLYFWGVIFIITTTLIMIFKHENDQNYHKIDSVSLYGDRASPDQTEVQLTLYQTYEMLVRIFRLRPIITYLVTLMLIKIGFSATDTITGLKLIEKGVSKEKMAFIGSLMLPVEILLALIASKHTTGSTPLNIFIKASVPRLMFGPIFCALVFLTPMFQEADGSYNVQYYFILALIYCLHQVFVYPMFVSIMAFYARISDPAVGGTYMTMLNTMSNLSSNIPNTIMLYLIDYITLKKCIGGTHSGESCSSKSELQACVESNPKGICETRIDGYYIEVTVCTVIGLISIFARRRYLEQIQSLPVNAWRVFRK